MASLLTAGAALVAALAMTPLAMVLARRTGLVDRPGALKVHAAPVPYLGGLGVAAGLACGVIPTRPALVVPLGGALALGIGDDAFELPPWLRLAAEVAAGVALAVYVPIAGPRWLGIVAVTVATVALINGVNMVDGLDGLAAGTGLVAATGFAVVLSGHPRTIAIALAGALVGFLAWNRPPARVYLGDGGAYLLGTALAALLAFAARPGHAGVRAPAAAVLIVAYPLVELGTAVLRRLISRSSLLAGDRDHLYDQLRRRGRGVVATVGACIALQAVLATVGVVGADRSPAVGAATLAACVIMVVAVAALGGFLVPTKRS